MNTEQSPKKYLLFEIKSACAEGFHISHDFLASDCTDLRNSSVCNFNEEEKITSSFNMQQRIAAVCDKQQTRRKGGCSNSSNAGKDGT